jgi:organic radical activating enzyme
MQRISIPYIFIELTTECNFHCAFCPIHEAERSQGNMPFDHVLTLLRELRYSNIQFRDITFSLQNEPFMYPRLLDVIRIAKEYNFPVNLPTNASLLSCQSFSNLLDYQTDRIVLSVHSVDAQGFKFRGSTHLSYDAYMDNIRSLVAHYVKRLARGEKTSSLLELHYMRTSHLRPRYKGIESNFEIVAISAIWCDFVLNEYTKYGYNYADLDIPSQETLSELAMKGKDRNELIIPLLPKFSLRFTSAHSWANSICQSSDDERKPFRCIVGYQQLCISWEGDCTTCCLDYNFENTIGNVWQSGGISNVWNNDVGKQFRSKLQIHCPPSQFCVKCGGNLS